MMAMPKKTLSVVGALVVTAGALSFSVVDTPVVLQADHSISIKNLQFNPGVMEMAVGDTVTWSNNETDGSSPEPTNHNINADDGSFTSPENVAPGQTFSHTPQSAGTITYRCRIHPQTFGELRVSGPHGEAPPPPPPSDPPPEQEDPGGGGLLPGLPGLEIPPLPIQAGAVANPFGLFADLMGRFVR